MAAYECLLVRLHIRCRENEDDPEVVVPQPDKQPLKTNLIAVSPGPRKDVSNAHDRLHVVTQRRTSRFDAPKGDLAWRFPDVFAVSRALDREEVEGPRHTTLSPFWRSSKSGRRVDYHAGPLTPKN
jgi:hypothetical protein